MPSVCSVCRKPVEGKFLVCSGCGEGFHLGKNCSAITDSAYTKMSTVKRETWMCQTCKSGTSSNQSNASLDPHFSAINSKLDQLTSTVEMLMVKVEELLSFKATCEKMAETVSDIQTSIDFLSEKYDSVLSTLTVNQTEMSQLKAEVESLSATVARQTDILDKTTLQINELEQYGRRCNLVIHGLPLKPNEDLKSFMCDLAGRLKLTNFQEDEICKIHRLPTQDKSNTSPPILVQFQNASVQEKWFRARKDLPDLAEPEKFPRLYFNENLTRMNSELFRLARSKGKENGFKFVWTRNGKVLARKSEGAPFIRIEKLSDLDKIV